MRFFCVQQRLDQPRAGLMQSVARGLLDGFEIERTRLAPLSEHHA